MWKPVLCLLCLIPVFAQTQPVVRLADGQATPLPGKAVQVLIDKSGKLSFEQIRSTEYSRRFLPNNGASLAFGSSNAVIWLRFRAVADQPGDWLLESTNYMINDLRFYSISERSGKLHISQQGSHFLDSPKDIQHNLTYFRPFPFSTTSDTVTCYLRVWNAMPLVLPMRFITVRQMAEESHRNDLFHGLLFGILMAMALYNGFLLIAIRDVAYLYYVAYVLFILLATDIGGYTNELVMAKFFPQYSFYASVVYSLALVFILLFARRFLDTPRHSMRINQGITCLLVACSLPQLFIILGFRVQASIVMEGLIIATAIYLWCIGIYLLMRGVREARFYVLAWSIFFLSAVMFVAQLNGLLPQNLLTVNGVRVGTALETVLLSFALADRINVYRRENFQAQTQLFESIREREQTKTKLAETENKLLRAQINPHFLFNSLNSIQRFILSKEPLIASDYLGKFANLMRFNLDQSRSATTLLQREIEMLTVYLQLESLRFNGRFTYCIDVAPDLNTYAVSIPGMMLQPFVENAIWHGVMHKPDNGHICINFTQLTVSRLRCTVEDNGVGRKRSAELESVNRIRHRSAGLSLTTERLALLNEDHYVGNPLVIDDLYQNDGTSAGTRVTIDLPTY
ncbi:histidine kinase [Spirosoma sp. BT702]|uniref:Histidine kinase n=1 Tax=Spirosoma profusum TaxID=2771354 RepID=A0A927AMI6_9BACT|nr:7TM diverse intracellular signaling domain-containing protein [Spirosoma profusum]MBD2699914.1 histidine kinase [Spirosoma profusum]